MSPKAIKIISDKKLNLERYPDGKCETLRNELSKKYKCNFDKIICGAGSDEVIQMICQLFLKPKDEVVVPEYSFLMYRIYTKIVGAKVIFAKEVKLKVSSDEILKKVNKKTKIVFLANPNNPTGTYLTKKEILKLRKKLNKKIKIFIQVNVGNEEQKSGINKDNLIEFYNYCKEIKLDIIGLMCLPPANLNPLEYFKEMKLLKKTLIGICVFTNKFFRF